MDLNDVFNILLIFSITWSVLIFGGLIIMGG